jgi:phenylalanine-4-hydroxylase
LTSLFRRDNISGDRRGSHYDVYDHLLYFTLSRYVEIQEMFALAFHNSQTDEQCENIKRLASLSTEFGLIRQKGELKIFGTGLNSSKDSMKYVLAGNIPVLPFKVNAIIIFDNATWSYNDQ